MNVAHALRGAACRGGGRARPIRLAFMTLILGTIFKYIEVAVQLFINFADTCQVIEAVAIVRGGPDGGQLAIKKLLIALLANLVRTVNPNAPIRVQESLHHISAKHVPCPSI